MISPSHASYKASIALQVNDPQERQARTENVPRVSSTNLFVDPIQSELPVLGSVTIREKIVDAVGIRLARVPTEASRSALMRDIWVSQDLGDYESYRLVYNADGTHTRFIRVSDNALLGDAGIGAALSLGYLNRVMLAADQRWREAPSRRPPAVLPLRPSPQGAPWRLPTPARTGL